MNKSLNCNELQKTINRLKSENILLKDQLLITKQENIVLNNVRIESVKCIEILNKIIDQLFNSEHKEKEEVEKDVQNEEKNVENKEQNVENEGKDEKLDVEKVEQIITENETNIDSLRCNYETNYSQLNKWFKQLDIIKSINKFPRFEVTQYEERNEKPIIRRSNRLSLPVDHFLPFGQSVKIEKDSMKRCEERPILSSSKNKSCEVSRLRCPFPGCGFSTRRGVIGLKEHSILHTRSYNNDNESKVLVPKVNHISKGKSTLSCSYPDCVYTTNWGMYSLRRHINRIHSKNSSPKKSSNSPNKVVEDVEQLTKPCVSKTKTVLHCSYTDCNYTTVWGMCKLRLHMRRHMTRKQTKNSSSNRNDSRNVLRCTKCSYKTKWGLSTLRKHSRIHDREQPFKCDKCDASYGSVYSLSNHKKLLHQNIENRKNFVRNRCNLCNKTFRDSYGLRRHRKTHDKNNQSYECPHEECFFRTNIIGIFQKHVVTHLLKDKIPENVLIEDSNSCDITSNVELIEPKKEKDVLVAIEIPEKINSELINEKSSESVLFNFGSHLMKSSIDKSKKTKRSTNRNTRNSSKSTTNKDLSVLSEEINVETSGQNETPITNRLMQTLLNSNVFEYECDAPNCLFSSNNAEEWIKHNDKHEAEEKSKSPEVYKCSHCKHTFNKLSRLEAHKRMKKHYMHKCIAQNCGKQFRTFQLLQKHSISGHRKSLSILDTPAVTEHKFKCSFDNCDKSFAKDLYRRRHLKNIHSVRSFTPKKRVISETVPQFNGFIVDTQANNPLLASMLRPVVIPQQLNDLNKAQNSMWSSSIVKCPSISCDKTFISKNGMISHFNKCHKQIKDSELLNITDESSRCPHCGLLFANNGNMKRHRTQAHKNFNNTSSYSSETSFNGIYTSFSERLNFSCQRTGCGKWFDSALNLREHLNLEHNKNSISNTSNDNHEYEVDFNQSSNKCDICDIDFMTLYQLEDHFRTFHELRQQTQEISSMNTDLDTSATHNQNLFSDNLLPFQESTQLLISPTVEQTVENLNSYNNMDNILTTIKVEQF